jgi:hypothetical protein
MPGAENRYPTFDALRGRWVRRGLYLQLPVCPELHGGPEKGIYDCLLGPGMPQMNSGVGCLDQLLNLFYGLDDISGIRFPVPVPE